MATKKFNGVIKLDVRDSKPDWTPYELPKRAQGRAERPDRALRRHRARRVVAVRRPHQHADAAEAGRQRADVLAVAHDGALLADALDVPDRPQPPRESLRVDHGRRRRIPRRGGPPARRVRDDRPGAPGQRLQHVLARQEPQRADRRHLAAGGSKSEWPLQKGFDRFYGFLGGETNNWYPDLVEDNHFIEQPDTPEDGYHLSKDLADQALKMLRDQRSANPSKPWFMWFCPGANHAPHHSPKEYADKYKGKFDDGYEAYREWVLRAHDREGAAAEGHAAHADQSAARGRREDEPGRRGPAVEHAERRREEAVLAHGRGVRRLLGVHRRAGRTHHRVPRETKQLDNTIIFYCADNGASGEGTPNGSVNENKFFNGYPDDLAENLKYLDMLGGPDTYNHYPTGWAVAFSTPFQMFKRYSQFSGGTCDPLVIHWPKGIKAKGEVRHQYHHSTDIVPTILDVVGLEMPKIVPRRRAVSAQRRLDALHLRRREGADDRRSGSTTRCSARAASGRTAGRRRRCTRRSAASATSTRTAGSCTTSTPTAPSRRTSRRRIRRSSRS